jgi:hypothetical protein
VIIVYDLEKRQRLACSEIPFFITVNAWFFSLYSLARINKVFILTLKYSSLGMKNQKKNRKVRRKEILAEILSQQSP